MVNNGRIPGIMGEMMAMAVGDVLTFPIRDVLAVRNRVTTLNAMHYRDGSRWRSISDKESGVVNVMREA